VDVEGGEFLLRRIVGIREKRDLMSSLEGLEGISKMGKRKKKTNNFCLRRRGLLAGLYESETGLDSQSLLSWEKKTKKKAEQNTVDRKFVRQVRAEGQRGWKTDVPRQSGVSSSTTAARADGAGHYLQ